MRLKTFLHLLVTGYCLLVTGLAFADPVKDRLDALEKVIKGMQADSISRNERVASALSTVDQIKADYQALQGTIEANNHLISELRSEIFRLKADISSRLSAMEERFEMYDSQITKAVSKVLPKEANEMEAYKKGLDLVQDGDFLSAVSAFRNFLKTYPSSEFIDNAQYWIGDCYFALKDFPKAIKEFQVIADKHPNSSRLAGAVLKQGFAFSEMGMVDEAKLFLNKVVKGYPGSDESVRAKEKLEKLEQKQTAVTNDAEPLVPGVGTISAPRDSTSHIPLAPGVKQQPASPQGRPATPKE